VARDLGHTHRVIVPDLVGLGESEAPAGAPAYRAIAQARRLLALLDERGITRFAVVAHGLSGTIAVQLAATAPDRVRALALISTPLRRASGADELRRAGVMLKALTQGGLPWDRARGALQFLRAHDPSAAERLLSIVVGLPALVLWGTEDEQNLPDYGRELATILDAAWVPIRDAGHLLPTDRPERVAEELHAFLVSELVAG
jgi:pimeloyl-ACP methyl ester carboxylesterase